MAPNSNEHGATMIRVTAVMVGMLGARVLVRCDVLHTGASRETLWSCLYCNAVSWQQANSFHALRWCRFITRRKQIRPFSTGSVPLSLDLRRVQQCLQHHAILLRLLLQQLKLFRRRARSINLELHPHRAEPNRNLL